MADKDKKETENKLQHSDVTMLAEAVKELTKATTDIAKQVNEMKEELVKLRKSGRF